jgi:hypothetical protein
MATASVRAASVRGPNGSSSFWAQENICATSCLDDSIQQLVIVYLYRKSFIKNVI